MFLIMNVMAKIKVNLFLLVPGKTDITSKDLSFLISYGLLNDLCEWKN